ATGWPSWTAASGADARRCAGRRPRRGHGAPERRGRRRRDGGSRLRALHLPRGPDAELLLVAPPRDGRRELDTLEQRGVFEDRDQRARLRRLTGQAAQASALIP